MHTCTPADITSTYTHLYTCIYTHIYRKTDSFRNTYICTHIHVVQYAQIIGIYVYIYICSSTKIYLCIHIHIYIHRHTYKCAHTYIYTQVYIYISTYTQTYTYICTYTNILMDTHAHLHIKIKNKKQELPQHQAFLCTCMFCVSKDHRYPEVSLVRSFLTSCQKCSSFPKPHAISFSLFFKHS